MRKECCSFKGKYMKYKFISQNDKKIKVAFRNVKHYININEVCTAYGNEFEVKREV
jgi:hypothetical protein